MSTTTQMSKYSNKFQRHESTPFIFIHSFNCRRKKLQRAIDEHINHLGKDLDCSIECPDIGEYCLVKCGEKFDRGKIIGVDYSDISIKIFCVDTGAVVTTGLDHVYDLPDHLLKQLPFQVHALQSTRFFENCIN